MANLLKLVDIHKAFNGNPILKGINVTVEKGDVVVVLGPSGSGKTTFLRYIKQHSQKRLVVVAPTGVAAINAQGVTIHSFFQLPFGPILPNIPDRNAKNFKFNNNYR